MNVVGLDLNATHARAVGGPEGAPARVLPLEDGADRLPMAVNLEGRHPAVGKAGAALCREYPHLVCLDFLAHLGTDRTWAAGRRRLDAARAVGLVFERLAEAAGGPVEVVVAVPGYLTRPQAALLAPLARKARLHLIGSVSAPLALAAGAYARQPWSGPAVLVDVDDHALTWTIVRAGGGHAQVVDGKMLPQLNRRAWKACLLDAIADCCVRHGRRDPRDSGSAEQYLYDQLDDVFDAGLREQQIEVVIRASNWCQNLFLQPPQVRAYCNPLAQHAAEEIGPELAAALPAAPAAVLLTAAAGALPGLTAVMQDIAGDHVPVALLPADAAARAAHDLAGRFRRGDLTAGHHDVQVPLPKGAQPAPLPGPSQRVIPLSAADR